MNISENKSLQITERIEGHGTVIHCSLCNTNIFPKQILFRTTYKNGAILYNYIGKDGMDCFWQIGYARLCKKCIK